VDHDPAAVVAFADLGVDLSGRRDWIRDRPPLKDGRTAPPFAAVSIVLAIGASVRVGCRPTAHA
jgi:hypothetical protein